MSFYFVRFLTVLFLSISACGCASFATKKIDRITKKDKREAIYVAYPIIETKRESNASSFEDPEKEIFKMTDSLVKKSVHDLLDKRLPVRFADYDQAEYLRTKALLDSLLLTLRSTKLKQLNVGRDLQLPSDRRLLIIPYYVWTRSTEDYDKGKCGKVGYRDYVHDTYCTWTASDAILIVINRLTKDVDYFKRHRWDRETIFSPYESRVKRDFSRCARPLLRKLNK